MPSCGQGKSNVLILSANYGAGHYQVSNAIRMLLKEVRPAWDVKIFDFFSHVDPVFNQMVHFGYNQMLKYFAQGYQWYYDATKQLEPDSKWQRMLNRIGRQKLLETIQELSPDVIICTFPTPAGVVSNLKTRGKVDIPLITIITDVAVHSQWVHPDVDTYLVGADTVAIDLKKRGISPNKIHVTGIPLRQSFEDSTIDPAIWEQYGLDPSIFTLMIMGGGEGMLSGIDEICEELGALENPLQIIAVTGTNKTLEKKLVEISQTSKNTIKVLGYVENIAELMEISHLLLTKAGGVTCFEALAKKLPILLYKPLPGHEMSNVEFLTSNNAAIMVEDEKGTIEKIKMLIEQPEILQGMVKSIEPLSKPFATRDAVEIIIATVEDCQRQQDFSKSKKDDSNDHLYA